MKTQSPMNPEHTHNTDAGIDALALVGLDTALNLRAGLALGSGRRPGL